MLPPNRFQYVFFRGNYPWGMHREISAKRISNNSDSFLPFRSINEECQGSLKYKKRLFCGGRNLLSRVVIRVGRQLMFFFEKYVFSGVSKTHMIFKIIIIIVTNTFYWIWSLAFRFLLQSSFMQSNLPLPWSASIEIYRLFF